MWLIVLPFLAMLAYPADYDQSNVHRIQGRSIGGNGGRGGDASVTILPGSTIYILPRGGDGGAGGAASGRPVRASVGPSFSCATSTRADEQAICANPVLSDLDSQLADEYREARLRSPVIAAELQQSQRGWLRERASCLSDHRCLQAAYSSRIAQLKNWR